MSPTFRGNDEENIDLFYIGRAKQVFDDCINNNTQSNLINRENKTEVGLFERVCDALKDIETKKNIKKLLLGEHPYKKHDVFVVCGRRTVCYGNFYGYQ